MRSVLRLPALAFAAVFTAGFGAAVLPGSSAIAGIVFASVAGLVAAAAVSNLVAEPLRQLQLRLDAWQRTGLPAGSAHPSPRLEELAALDRSLDATVIVSAAQQAASEEALFEMLRNWVRVYEGRDPLWAGHGSRVANYAAGIAEAMGRPAMEVERIRLGALVHDIGKAGIGEGLLNKPDALTEAEMEVVKRHPLIGRRMLEGVAAFEPLLAMVELHHENFDGTGYPWGMRGSEIPLAARIVRVADAFDAITSDRPYRDAMPIEQAMEILRRGAGAGFDPDVVEAFLSGIHRQRVLVRPIPDQLASLQEGLLRGEPRARGNRAPVVSIEGAKARPKPAEEQEAATTGAPTVS